MPKTWEYQGDMDVLGYGGTFLRHVGDRRYHAIRFDNMDEACGSDNEGHPRYHGSLVEVDLASANIQAAADSWGEDASEHDDLALAFMVTSYGEYAPLHDEASNNGNKLIRDLKRMSREIEGDSTRYEALMSRPVNALGSTAREFQHGDFQSAMDRGLRSGNEAAGIMAVMSRPRQPVSLGLLTANGVEHGVSVDMSLTGSDDPAFAYGFSQGIRGETMATDVPEDELASEYVRGHAEGLKVFNGAELPRYATRQ
jgi:hypothetical protein